MSLGLKLKWTDYIPYQPYPKQLAFLLLPHREAFFGGAAGGGKSDALLMAALMYCDVPGYSALIIRKTFKDLSQPGALISRSHEWLYDTPAKWNNTDHTWTFPTHIPSMPATLSFGYLAGFQDKFKYQGSEFQCVAKGTLVKLANGTAKPVESLRIGDVLQTLQGPRILTRTFPARKAQCVLHVGPYGAQIHPLTHSTLTASGWRAFGADQSFPKLPIRPQDLDKLALSDSARFLSQLQTYVSPFWDRQQLSAPQQLPLDRQPGTEFSVSLTDDRSGYKESSGGSQEFLQPAWSCVPSVLSAPDLLSAAEPFYFHLLRSAVAGVQNGTSTLDFLGGYPWYRGSCGEQFLRQLKDARSIQPSQADAAAPSRVCLPWGCLGSIPSSSPMGALSHSHPYRNETQTASLGVQLWPCFATPIGEQEVYDITVDDANHYITVSGFINKNCVCVDEATHVSEEDYCYVGFTRCRKPRCGQHPKIPDPNCETCRKRQLLSQVPLRTRAASNPPSIGQGEWVKLRFSVQEVDGIYRGTHPKRAYIPSFVQDNPALDPEEYADSLSNVDPVTRAQLLKGDWGAKTEGRFKPSWFRGRTWVRSGDMWNVGSKGLSTSAHVLEDSSYLTGRFIGPGAAGKRDAGRHFPESYHTSELLWFVMTDPAASYREGPGDKQIWRREPSWTVFGLFGLTPKGDLLVVDVARFQREIPDVIRGLHGFIRRCVKGGTSPQFIGIEANGVGKGVYQQCQRDGLPVVDCTRHTHDKFIYATPAMNRAAYGQIYLPAQPTTWLDAFTSELYGYTGHPQVDTGDQVDILAHAAQYAHSRSVLGEQVWPTDVADMVGNF